jgi:hypothetical protein
MSESHDQIDLPSTTPRKNRKIWQGVFFAVLGLAVVVLYTNRSKDREQGLLPDPRGFPGVGNVVEGLALEPLCGFCQVEMPHLVKIMNEHRHRHDFQFVSISCNGPGEPDERDQLLSESKQFLDSKGFDFAVHWDPDAKARMTIVAATRLPADDFGYPTTLLLDRKGAIQALWKGYGRGMEAEIAQMVKELLKKKT